MDSTYIIPFVDAGKNDMVANVFPRGIFVLLALYIAAWFLLEKTPFGIKIKCIGGNEKAARLSGVEIEKMKLRAYVITGALCGISGMMLAGRLMFVDIDQFIT